MVVGGSGRALTADRRLAGVARLAELLPPRRRAERVQVLVDPDLAEPLGDAVDALRHRVVVDDAHLGTGDAVGMWWGIWGVRGFGVWGGSARVVDAHLARAARHLLAVGPRGEGGAATHVLEDHLEELFLLVLVVVVDRQRHVLRRLVVACGASGMPGEMRGERLVVEVRCVSGSGGSHRRRASPSTTCSLRRRSPCRPPCGTCTTPSPSSLRCGRRGRRRRPRSPGRGSRARKSRGRPGCRRR